VDAISWVLDAAAQMNRTEVAKELSVSRDTINRYKNRLAEMNRQERILLTSALGRKQLLKEATR
jgi:transposase